MDNRQIPHSLEAEQAVISSIFLDGQTLKVIADRLTVDDFYNARHKLIFAGILRLYEQDINIDYFTLIDHLRTRDELLDAGDEPYLDELIDAMPSAANLEYYINIVKDKAIVRKMIQVTQKIAEQGYKAENMSEYIDEAEKDVFQVASARRTSGFIPIKEATEAVIEKTEEAKKKEGSLTGLSMGFPELDRFTLGLQKEELYIVAARPSMGKSAFALNIAMNVASNMERPHVAVFSLEMGVEQLVGRILAAESRVNSYHIQQGKLSSADWEQLSLAKSRMDRFNIVFDDSGTVRVTDLRQKCRKLKQENRLDLVIIDYLQLLSGTDRSRNQNRVTEVSEISRILKEMARELKIPVIALSQLSRNVETRTEKRPIMADLRESGSIEQDADVIVFLYREEYYNKTDDNKNQIEIIIAKNRSGAITSEPIKMLFQKEYSLFRPTIPYAPRQQTTADLPDA